MLANFILDVQLRAVKFNYVWNRQSSRLGIFKNLFVNAEKSKILFQHKSMCVLPSVQILAPISADESQNVTNKNCCVYVGWKNTFSIFPPLQNFFRWWHHLWVFFFNSDTFAFSELGWETVLLAGKKQENHKQMPGTSWS